MGQPLHSLPRRRSLDRLIAALLGCGVAVLCVACVSGCAVTPVPRASSSTVGVCQDTLVVVHLEIRSLVAGSVTTDHWHELRTLDAREADGLRALVTAALGGAFPSDELSGWQSFRVVLSRSQRPTEYLQFFPGSEFEGPFLRCGVSALRALGLKIDFASDWIRIPLDMKCAAEMERLFEPHAERFRKQFGG